MNTGVTRKAWVGLLAGVVAIGLVSAPVMARSVGQVDEFRPWADKLVFVKGEQVKRKVLANKVRVVLKDRAGRTSRADVNELAPGAKVLRLVNTNRDRQIEKVVLRELPSGTSDCSFDLAEDGTSGSWDCSLDYEGVDEDRSVSCSFDRSQDASGGSAEGDRSRDVSWDCSFDESGDDGDLSWDASFDASESASWGPSGGDSDGDTSFSASWGSSVPVEKPLFSCRIQKDPLGWSCESAVLEQAFGVTLDGAPVGFDAYLDLSEDYVELDDDATSSSCTKDGPGSFSCSFDTGSEQGDCSVDVSFDSSVAPNGKGGDVSGDMSYSCSYDVG